MSEAQENAIYNVVVPRYTKALVGGVTNPDGTWKADVGEHVRAIRRQLDYLDARIDVLQSSVDDLRDRMQGQGW